MVKNLSTSAEDSGMTPGSGRCLEKEIAIHSSILAWEIPWTKEPGGLQSMGLQSQIQLSNETTTAHSFQFSNMSTSQTSWNVKSSGP